MPLQGSSSSKKIIVELLPLLFHALNLRAAHGVRGVVRGVAGVRGSQGYTNISGIVS